jgi:addiction module HigA family antidote
MDRRMTSKSSTTTRKKIAQQELLPLITPGEFLVEEFMQPLGLSANALANALKVPANRILAIIKGQRGITADTALRLAQYFGTTAEFWMNLQQTYELDSTRREKLAEIQREIPRRPPAKEEARPGREGARHSGD